MADASQVLSSPSKTEELSELASDLKNFIEEGRKKNLEAQEKLIQELKNDVSGIYRLLQETNLRSSDENTAKNAVQTLEIFKSNIPNGGDELGEVLKDVVVIGGEALQDKIEYEVTKTKIDGLLYMKDREDKLRGELEEKAVAAQKEDRARDDHKFDKTVDHLVTIRKEDRLDRIEQLEREKTDREQERLKNEEEIKWLQAALVAAEEKSVVQLKELRQEFELEKERMRKDEQERSRDASRLFEEQRTRERDEWEKARNLLLESKRTLEEERKRERAEWERDRLEREERRRQRQEHWHKRRC